MALIQKNTRIVDAPFWGKKMRVCLVSTHYPSDDAIGEYCGHMAEELCKKTEVVVLGNENPNLPTVSRIQSKYDSSYYTAFRIWKPGFSYPFKIFRNIIKQKPDIVHVQHEYFLYGKGYRAILFPLVLLMIKMSKIPLVVTMHHVIPLEEVGHFRKLLGTVIPDFPIKAFLTFFNGLFAVSSKIIVPSTAFKRTLSNEYKINEKKIEVVQHFAYPNTYSFGENANAKVSMGLDKKKIILFFGYIRPTKGIEYVLQSFRKVVETVPNAIFSIVGKAQANYVSYFDYLKQLVNDLNLNSYVRFENHVPEESLPTIFAASDAVVFPYTSTIGMTPIAHFKAASFGKPIIVSDIDSFRNEFVDRENALLVPQKDSEALAKSIIEVFTDEALSKRLSSNIALYCEKRSQKRAINNITKIYCSVLERKLGNKKNT
jgi:glycosyltransferase involved in cell wall biosynthesis